MNFHVENHTSEAEAMLCNDAALAQYSRVRAQYANRLVPLVRVTGKQHPCWLRLVSLPSESEVVSGPQSSEGCWRARDQDATPPPQDKLLENDLTVSPDNFQIPSSRFWKRRRLCDFFGAKCECRDPPSEISLALSCY